MKNLILLIDDDEDECLLLEMALQYCSYSTYVHQITHFAHVVDFADTHPVTPSVIFLDLHMPDRSGLDIIDWLKAHQRMKTIPVVVWSHSENEREINESYVRGADQFLSKIADADIVRDQIRHICASWLR